MPVVAQLPPALWHAHALPLLPRASTVHHALGSASLSVDHAAWGVMSELQKASSQLYHSDATAWLGFLQLSALQLHFCSCPCPTEAQLAAFSSSRSSAL